MFKSLSSIFNFFSPSETEPRFQPRKPMAIPVVTDAHNIQLCIKIFTQLDEAEAEVLADINDPEKAWLLLSKIRQLRRESQQDFAVLLSASPKVTTHDVELITKPLRTVLTQSGAQLTVFNGGRSQ